jgi:hypothetical protein
MCEYVEVLLVLRQRRCIKFFNDLEVGYIGFIMNAYAGT